MDALDPQWKDDLGMKAFDEFLARDFPEGSRANARIILARLIHDCLARLLEDFRSA